jgi:diguanylate cyclase (GGDEF)-like protein
LISSTATFVAFLLLFLLIRMINQVQENIQDVTLRDELTGLLSVKGFYLLAEQAFRHCRRAQEGFGVLFVDMDNLKKINDELGHSTGSVALVETAKLLKTNFRDADIIGRVGGDEFVVVSQFESHEITEAIERLRAAVARKNKAIGQRFSISLSIGYAVADDLTRETLQSLVLKADEAMYAEKRSKKMRPGITPRAGLAQLELQ